MNNHKLEIDVSLNGYEVIVSDVTGFGPEGYNEDGLNQNNVNAILLVLEDDLGNEVAKVRLEGMDKNKFMGGQTQVSLKTSEGPFKPKLRTAMYYVNSYLMTKESEVNGLANFSDVVGSGFNLLVEDNYAITKDEVYEVMKISNGDTLLSLNRPLVEFTNKMDFGFKFKFSKPIYVNAMSVLFQLGSMTSNTLQKDGEAPNFAVLAGYLQTAVMLGEDDTRLYRVLRNADVVSRYLGNKYFRM